MSTIVQELGGIRIDRTYINKRKNARPWGSPKFPNGGVAAGWTGHETANYDPRSTAKANAAYYARAKNLRASVTLFVDDGPVAYQSSEWDEQCWHAGDGTGPGNTTYVAMEICTRGNIVKAWQNGIAIMRDSRAQGLVGNGLEQHAYFMRKNCPRLMRQKLGDLQWLVDHDYLSQERADYARKLAGELKAAKLDWQAVLDLVNATSTPVEIGAPASPATPSQHDIDRQALTTGLNEIVAAAVKMRDALA